MDNTPDASIYNSVDGSDYHFYYATDVAESNKVNAYVPAPAGDSRPWWERVAEYGMTRAIDANFGAQAQLKGSVGATYAGQDGKTYVIGSDGKPVAVQQAKATAGVPGWAWLLGAAGLAFALLH